MAVITKGARVWVAGHNGLVGSGVARRVASTGAELLTVNRSDLDLRRQSDVEAWMAQHKPDVVIIAAAVVGGILANRTRPAEFLSDNLLIETSIINSAHEQGVKRLVFLSSSCVYPRLAEQPIAENSMLTGPLEPTNEWYAVAKIAGQKLCDALRRQYGRDYISLVPATIYGPGDNFDLEGGHVLPTLMRRFHEGKQTGAPEIALWGTGSPIREFLHVDDLADAVVFAADNYVEEGPLNVPALAETSIRDLAAMMQEVTGYKGKLAYDTSKPDGMPRKVVDGSRLNALGWRPSTALREGLRAMYDWYCDRLERGLPVRGHP
ncbi:MAG: GDP-L-fucose synthase [Terricaulis sp.]